MNGESSLVTTGLVGLGEARKGKSVRFVTVGVDDIIGLGDVEREGLGVRFDAGDSISSIH